MIRKLALVLSLPLAIACNAKKEADTILYNAKIYCVDSAMTIAEALAIKDGNILDRGTSDMILSHYSAKEQLDLQQKPVYPGFIDAHGHFTNYARNLNLVNLEGALSEKEMTDRVWSFAEKNPLGWLCGRGWDQNRWESKQYPTRHVLDSLFPDRPVLLTRIDGHAALANGAALRIAGISEKTLIPGGKIITISEKGKTIASGVVIDNAVDSISKHLPPVDKALMRDLMLQAQNNCYAVGLSSVSDAGLELKEVLFIDSIQKAGILRMNVYAMLNPSKENKAHFLKKPYKTGKLNVCSFKLYADGALGSRGACLLKPYSDMPKEQGFLLNTPKNLEALAEEIGASDYQLNTHSIGDSSARFILKTYGKVLKGRNDRRWRIEHCQVVNKADLPMFSDYSVIPSVQPVHATSDMAWADERLGVQRVKDAYAYKELLASAGMIAYGSDFPVESINPLFGFYAAIVRKDQQGEPREGFQVENAISRDEALKAMTIWAAYACREEKEKGSLEKGKTADIVVLEEDIMSSPQESLYKVKVLKTFVKGKLCYEAK